MGKQGSTYSVCSRWNLIRLLISRIPSSAANSYLYLPPEGLTINVLGSVIFALGLLVPVILLIFKRSPGVPSETGPDNVHYDSERL